VLASGTPSAPGAQFTGVAKIAVAEDHTCAVKTDGSTWCWGLNNVGQCGTGSTTPENVLNPQQVTALAAIKAADIQVSSGNNQYISCAVTSTTGNVWCWGANAFGQLPGVTAGYSATPVEITATPDADGGGTPLTRVTSISLTSNGPVYVLQPNALSGYPNTLSCWGYSCGNVSAVSRGGDAVEGVFDLCSQSGETYIDSSGQRWSGGTAVTMPACP